MNSQQKITLFGLPNLLVIEISPDGVVRDLNPYGIQMLRYSPKDLDEGLEIVTLIPGIQSINRFRDWIESISRNHIAVSNAALLSKDEILFDFDLSAVSVTDWEGNIESYLIVGKDVSTHVRLEKDIKYRDSKLITQSLALKHFTTSELLNSGNFELTIGLLIELLSLTIECERCSFWRRNIQKDKIVCQALYLHNRDLLLTKEEIDYQIQIKDDSPLWSHLLTGEVLASVDAKKDSKLTELKEKYIEPNNIGAILIIPVRFNGEIEGFLALSALKNPREWYIFEQNFAIAISNFVTIALESEKFKKELTKSEPLNSINPTESINPIDSDREAQSKFIHTEKMASLGNLIAGVAHEINTPLGAISASGTNLARSLPNVLKQLPSFFKQMSPDLEELFLKMVERSVSFTGSLSSREERQLKKELAEQLSVFAIEDPSTLAKELVKIGITDNIEELLPIFTLPNSEEYTQMAYDIGRLRVNIDNIGTAVAKTQKIVYALKSYSRRNSFDEAEMASIPSSVDTVLTIYHNQIKYGIELTTELDRAIPQILCFPDELIQVWTNIIHNAIQAMGGKGQLKVIVKHIDSNISVSVTDSGPGIPADVLPRIFEPFFTTKPEGEGSGLGLDICRKIVEKHKGTISVASVPGETTFEVKIPDKIVF